MLQEVIEPGFELMFRCRSLIAVIVLAPKYGRPLESTVSQGLCKVDES